MVRVLCVLCARGWLRVHALVHRDTDTFTLTRRHTNTHRHRHIHTNTQTYEHTQTQTHTHRHTDTDTHTHTHTQSTHFTPSNGFPSSLFLSPLTLPQGVNAVNFYAQTVLTSAGFDQDHAFYFSIYIGVVKVVFVAVGMALIDSAGRRVLMMTGIAGMTVSTMLLAAVFQVR